MELRLDQMRHKDAVDKKRRDASTRDSGGAGTPGAPSAVKSPPTLLKAGTVAEPPGTVPADAEPSCA